MKVEDIRENHKKVVSEERALRRKKIYEKMEKENGLINIQIPVEKLKMILAGASIVIIGAASIYGYQAFQEMKQETKEIQNIIENDFYLRDIKIYVNGSDADTELRIENKQTGIEELESKEDVAKYIYNNIGEEYQKDLAEYMGVSKEYKILIAKGNSR